MTIINPHEIIKGSLPDYSEDTLRNLIVQTHDEIFSIRRSLNDNKTIITDFLRDAIIINSDILLSVTKISKFFLNSTLILFRSFLEYKVDFLWFYYHYTIDQQIAENLAKRFYQLGAKIFIERTDEFQRIIENDPFLNTSVKKYNFDDDLKEAKSVNIIELTDNKSNKELRSLQNSNWRALPGLVKSRKEIGFPARSEIAAKVAKKIFNLKDAPY